MMNDSTQETLDHIEQVQLRLNRICDLLRMRAISHDASKLFPPEKAILDAKHKMLGELQYGSPEYAAALAATDMQPFLEHHYATNDHHPQHFKNGIDGMSLLSLMEMLADWSAASLRTKSGSIATSLEKNRTRFNIDPQTYAILVNTVRELEW